MKKTIGIIGRTKNINEREFLTFNKELIDIIYKYKCIPLGILSNFKEDDYKKWVDMCDGIILQGGDDIYPLDNQIIEYIYNKNIPTLGICLGMQLMGNAIGGKIKPIGSFSHQSNNSYVHKVKVNKNTKLYDILGSHEILVNSRHQDHLTKTNLVISALSEDGIIEGIEDPEKNFFIGIQWHPETINDENSNKIFSAFFDKVKSYHR